MQLELIGARGQAPGADRYDASLSQWMTPSWVAEAIVSHALSGPAPRTVIEPSCGTGRFLDALTAHLPEARVIGVEIDPALARIAARVHRAEVITGDYRTVDLPLDTVDAIIGNPPFKLDILDGFLARSHRLLDDGGRAILILPAFAFQTSARVVRYNQRWTISQEMLPRTIFPGIRLPLVLATFTRDRQPRLIGMLLYHEANAVEAMPEIYRAALAGGRSGWHAVVETALSRLGGEATVDEVCREIEPRRPTATRFWRPKVRQQLGRHFRRVGPARYAIVPRGDGR